MILPTVINAIIILVLILLGIQINVNLFLFINSTLFPYLYAFYREYSIKAPIRETKLSEYDFYLIHQKKNIIKSMEIFSIILSFLFGLFITFNFNLLLVQNPVAELIGYIGSSFGINFFMATLVFIQTQVLEMKAFLSREEIENLSTNSLITKKIENFIKKLKFANFVRKGCYFSLLVQISIFYPIAMDSLPLYLL